MALHRLTPKLVSCLKGGVSLSDISHDVMAGVVVGILSIPLGMAFAIASGLPPEKGLFTSIIAGFVVALFGGSRFQIAGPTGAFVVVVFDIVQRRGYEGLAVATLIAALLLIVMGLFRFGAFLKYIPYPVVTGMTSGLAVVLFTSQIKDFFGLKGVAVTTDFFARWSSYLSSIGTINVQATVIGICVIVIIVLSRRINEKIPAPVIAVVAALLAASLFHLRVDTIYTKFGQIPSFLPLPSWPSFTIEGIKDLMPDAITIAVLSGVESLLSAVVADSMSGDRHRPDMELVAQGIGNFGSILFGGIPATGAIARTASNVRFGARTPIAGLVSALVIALLLFFCAREAGLIPLCALAAIVLYIAVKMFNFTGVVSLLKATKGDALLLLTSFALTVVIDITVAVEIGVLLAALIFMKKMADSTTIESRMIGDEIQVVEVKGPLFYAVSHLLEEKVQVGQSTCVILRLHDVSVMDMTGIEALRQFFEKLKKQERRLLISEANPRIVRLLENSRLLKKLGANALCATKEEAIHVARSQLKTL